MFFRESLIVIHSAVIHASTVYTFTIHRLNVLLIGKAVTDEEILASIAIYRAQKSAARLRDYERLEAISE